jgi:hypothetical protein
MRIEETEIDTAKAECYKKAWRKEKAKYRYFGSLCEKKAFEIRPNGKRL